MSNMMFMGTDSFSRTRRHKYYETFELVEDICQETIGSYWVITKKEKHDGQKIEYKAWLVARGFQEIDKPQSDLPMVGKESLKLVIALVANKYFNLASMNIKAAFLQGNILNRNIFMKP